MKQITNKTILKQGDKTYNPVKGDGVIYWLGGPISLNPDNIWVYRSNRIWKFKQGMTVVSSNMPIEIIAQSQPKLEGIPVISLDSYVENLFEQNTKTTSFGEHGKQSPFYWFNKGYNSNPNQWTDDDIRKTIELARTLQEGKNEFEVENILGSSDGTYGVKQKYTEKEILKQINSISVIEVDTSFNIIGYE